MVLGNPNSLILLKIIRQKTFYDSKTIKFILWQYENMLREKNRFQLFY